MTQGLPVSRLINVNLILTPAGAAFANFNSLLILGESNVINVVERIRSYGSLLEVATDFGTSAPEYLAADLFFSQVPTPTQLYIGRWAQTATHGQLLCGPLSATQQAIGNWTTVTAGSFKVSIDGSGVTNIGSLNFSAASNLNAVAADIQTALQAIGTGGFTAATCVWNGFQFVITSGTTGASSTVSAMTTGNANDISVQIMGTAGELSQLVPGIVAETALQCVVIMDQQAVQWYALTFAAPQLVDADVLAVAGYIEGDGTNNPHLFGVTTAEAAAVVSPDTTSIGYQLKQLDYNRTFTEYSSTTLYAVASLIGRFVTVNFFASNSTITGMYKQQPGVVAESLTSSKANQLNANNYNYYANFNNGTAITVNAVCASGVFIDTMWDLDFLVNDIQTRVYNLLYTSPTKIPQTDAGMHQIATQIGAACIDAVNNDTLAPGVWNSQGFGQLQQGDFLSQGFYIYQPPIALQAENDRAARKSVPFQVAAKLAGAVHTVQITVTANQ